MTCDEESIKRQTQPKYYCSLDAWKQNSEASKKLHNSVRPLVIQEERAEMAKNRRRYIEDEMKKLAEQQAKHRDTSTVTPQIGMIQQQMPHSQFAPAPGSGSGYNLMPGTPMSLPGRPINPRKRVYEDNVTSWPQQPMPMCKVRNGITSHPNSNTGASQSQYPHMQMLTQVHNKMEMRAPSYGSCMVADLRHQNLPNPTDKPSTSNCMTSTQPYPINDRRRNGSSLIDLGDSQMRNFMDQITAGNTLNDLGDNCLDGVLNVSNDCQQQEPSTSAVDDFDRKLESPSSRTIASVNSNSIVSPVSLTAHTPNEGLSSATSNSISRNNSMSSEKADSASSRRPTPDTAASNSAYGNPLGPPLSTSTPSSMSPSSCCFSQIPSTSGYVPTGVSHNERLICGNTVKMMSQACIEQPHVFSSNNDVTCMQPNTRSYGIVPQPLVRQSFPYMVGNEVEGMYLAQQRFMNPAEMKRQQMVNNDYSIQTTLPTQSNPYEVQAKSLDADRVPSACSQRSVVSSQYQTPVEAVRQMQQVPNVQGQMFHNEYAMHPSMQRPQSVTYHPGYHMGSIRQQQQMPMYHANVQMPMPSPQQQFPNGCIAPSQPYFPPSNPTYRYL